MLERPENWTNQLLTPGLELWEAPGGEYKTLRTRLSCEAGEPILDFGAAEILPEPVRYSLQFGADRHGLLAPEFLKYVNHSCRPTILFDFEIMKIRALQALPEGSELLCFYPSTEWEMDQPFCCNCGMPECLGLIRGASQMSSEALTGYTLAAHIKELLDRREAQKAAERSVQAVFNSSR